MNELEKIAALGFEVELTYKPQRHATQGIWILRFHDSDYRGADIKNESLLELLGKGLAIATTIAN